MATNNAWNNTISDANSTLNGGTVSIGTDATSNAINIGTGAAARTITIGNITGATAVNVDIGTGDFTLDSATGNLVTQLDTGEMTKPLQPAFLATLDSDDVNVTGGGTTYTIGTNVALTEIFDQGGDFNTNGTFTAPVTGRYYLHTIAMFDNITTSMINSFIFIVTSNRSYQACRRDCGNVFASNLLYDQYCYAFADMDAADTAIVDVFISGGADTADLRNIGTRFAGYLVC